MSTEPNLGDVRLVTDGVWYRIERYREVGFWRWKRRVWIADDQQWANRVEADFYFQREKNALERGNWRVIA